MKLNRKQIIGLVAMVLVAAVAIGGLALWLHENKLEQLQNEALVELERNAGQYDEQSIVLCETSKVQAEKLAKLYGAKLRITKNGRFATLTLPEGTTIRDVYAMEESRKYIDKMAADYHVQVSELTEEESGERLPARPQYSVSDTDYELQTYLDYLNMGEVWNHYTGSGVTVAVIDTGIDTDHPEFAGRISEYSYNASEDKIVKDYVLEDGNYDWSLIEDAVGHGTAVTGVIAATMNRGSVVGIAPNVNILVIKVESDASGGFNRTSDLVFGLYYAIERDVDVVNMSFGGYTDGQLFEDAARLAYDSDVICVAAAGNDATSALCWPAANEYVIGVGALDGWDLAYYSNYGENVDVMAPGTTYTSLKDGEYGTEKGTSLASPIVAGAIALYMQSDKYATFDDVTALLHASSYDLGDPGRDWYYGYGALDVSALVLEERGKVIYDMLTDELENEEGIFIIGHTLQELPEPERLYAVFDGWYYDDTFTQEFNYYEDKFYGEVTLYAKWANEEDGVPYTYVVLEDGTVEITGYTGSRRYITVPEKIEGRTVSSIGDFAFAGHTRLREVTLPSSLTNIGQGAFQNCANLISVEIPANVTEIEDYAFDGDVRLSSVAFLGNSKLTTIGNYAFSRCASLKRIELPASVQSVNGSAFYGAISLYNIAVQQGNSALKSQDGVLFDLSGSTLVAFPAAWGSSYTIPTETSYIGRLAFAFAKTKTVDLASVTAISGSAFAYAELETLNIPDSVTTIEGEAFSDNASLTEVTIGRGMTQIPFGAFRNASNLQSIEIPNGITVIAAKAFDGAGLKIVTFEEGSVLTQIGDYAFGECAISQIVIPASVQTIGGYAFLQNPLTSVTFAENSVLQTVGAGAFYYCRMLSQIELPTGVNTIGAGAFYACSSLKNITLPAELEVIGDQAFSGGGLTTVTIPAGVKVLGAGAFASCSELMEISVEEGNANYHDIDGVVYSLDNTALYAFPGAKEAQVYALENTVRSIMPLAFAGVSHVDTIVLPEGLTEAGAYSFYLCRAYAYSLPSTLTHIGEYAFAQNRSLSTIQLPDALVQISEYAFAQCVMLQQIHIPDSVAQIGRYAFFQDWQLQTVSFNETASLPRLGYGAFAYSGITDFRVPANVSTMAQRVFEGCENLTSITFAAGSKLESISAYMFDGCPNLRSITFEPGSALTSIQAHGLEGLDNLTSIDFGDAKLSNIDNFAFRFCESLSGLDLPDSVTNIGRYAFYGCESLTKLAIPVNVAHIGSYAFLGTYDMELYFLGEALPAYLDENWDYGTKGYFTGVASVEENADCRYAVLTSGNIAILEYLGTDTTVDLTQWNLGGNITTIGGSAFEGSAVQSIVLPQTLTAIQAEAFAYSALENIVIPASVTFIGREAFAHTQIHTLSFAAGSQLTVIEQYAFEGTKHLASVDLPASLTTLGIGVFQQSGLESVTFENGIALTEIPQKAFAGTKLTSVALPDSVTLVNHNAFNNVQSLASVTFGNNDGIRLMSNAFYRTGLTTLHIPANVTYIGEYCFVALSNLTEFTVDENNPNYMAVDGLLLNKSGRKLIAVPAGRTGSLTVPLTVEEIGFSAFEESKLSQILFHEDANILSIGCRAFFKAEHINAITIPQSVVTIDYYAFAYCENLKEVIFAEGSQIKGIYEGAFCGDINLECATVPNTIVEISDFAFYGCSKITELPVSDLHDLKGIYDYAFAYTGLHGDFVAPESLIDIGNYAFLGTKLESVTIPDANKRELIIGLGAFEECSQMTEITLPFIGASLEDDQISWFGYIFGAGSYAANAEYVPESLKTVTITDGVTMIGIGGFAYCSNIELINVPHSVDTLWNDAFLETTAKYELTNTILTCWYDTDDWYNGQDVFYWANSGYFGTGLVGDLVLADGVTQIGYAAFRDCGSLTGITIPGSVSTFESLAFYNCNSLSVVTILEGVTSIEESAFQWCPALTDITLPESLTCIGTRAFIGCSSLTSITIPAGVSSIGDGAFYGCSSLTQIEFPAGLTSLAPNLLYGCSSLTSVTIPKDVTSIGASAFYDCSGLTQIELPAGLTDISSNMFAGCSSLTSITIPAGVTSIGERAFSGCSGLRDIAIPAGVTEIGEYAFARCAGLGQIEFPAGLTSIANGMLYNCSGLTEITIPAGVTDIGQFTFANCESLTQIVLPDALTSIAPDMFSGCSSLTGITIPAGVTSIGEYAFYYCGSLTDLTISAGVTSIGAYAFSHCDSLTEITIPAGMTDIGANAFYWCYSLIKVTNNSDLPMEIGSAAYGYVASNADVLIDKYGNKTYRDGTMFETEDHFLVSYCDNVYILLAYIGDADTVTLPADINGCSYIIRNFYGAENVIIPEGITEIGVGAFSNCRTLTSITIPDSVTEIDGDAFEGCTALKEIVLSDNAHFCYMDGILYNDTITRVVWVSYFVDSDLVLADGVSALEDYLFSNRMDLTSITLPDSVRTIPSGAFAYCSNLVSVNIPQGVISIGSSAFRDCTSLTSITIPDGVMQIGSSTFDGCTGLTSINIPDSVTEIYMYAFNDCTALKEIVLSDNAHFRYVDGILYDNPVTKIVWISNYVSDEIVIADGVTSIKKNAFSARSNLTSVTIPAGVTSIGEYAFQDCIGLTSVIIADTVTQIGAYAFDGCSNLLSITIPESVESIGFGALPGNATVDILGEQSKFRWSDGILYSGDYAEIIMIDPEISGNITLPDGLKSIPENAFSNCTNLTGITIPASVTSIGKNAFGNCTKLASVVLLANVTIIENSTFSNCTSLRSITIPEGVTHIESAFYGCTSLTSILLPDSLMIIDSTAFENCVSLTSITIPEGVTKIGSNAFYGCTSLANIQLPDSLTDIGWNCFRDCTSLTSITLPEGLTQLGDYAFIGCTGLTNITLPGSITAIGEQVFASCKALTSITISEGVTSLGRYVFSQCSNLQTVVLPSTLTSIGEYALADCAGLTSIVIPDGVTSIGDYAFYNCSRLASVTIPESVTSIGRYAFFNCILLTDITLPNSLTSIGEWAFYECSKLESITIPEGVTDIGEWTFASCTSLADITIPDGVTSIGDYAFYYCGSLTSFTVPQSIAYIGQDAFFGCGSLMLVINESAQQLMIGDAGNGYVAYYAAILKNRDGNNTYRDDTWFETEDHFVFSYSDGFYYLHAYLGEEDTVTLPKDYNGNSYMLKRFVGASHVIIPDGVTRIDGYAFERNKELISITIPNSVTYIGENAFSGCVNLKDITLSDRLTEISWYAFQNCDSLISIEIPESVTSIAGYAFGNCSALTSVVIPDSVTHIASEAFTGCTALQDIQLTGDPNFCYIDGVLYNNPITQIVWVSYGCPNEVVIVDGVTAIGVEVFRGRKNVTSVKIPDSVIYIDETVFRDQLHLCDPEYLDYGMYVIDGWLIDVDEDVRYLENIEDLRGAVVGAYDNCHMLKNAVLCCTYNMDQPRIPKNVETIYIKELSGHVPRLQNTVSLKNIVICDSVSASDMRDAQGMFAHITGVTIYVDAPEEDLRWDDNFPGWNNGNIVVYRDAWNYVNFYDTDGKLLSSEIKLNSEVIRRPVVVIPENTAADRYTFIGWDLDGDGLPDSVPATTVTDIHATVIITHVHTHVYGEWYVQKAAHCTEEGAERRDCITCDLYESRVLASIGHNYIETVAAPTCTERGYTIHTCFRCGDSYEDSYVDANGHSHTAEVTTAPACETTGVRTYTCHCGDSYTEEIPATGHLYTHVENARDATCGIDGYTGDTVCDDCGKTIIAGAVIPATGNHSYTSQVTIAPGCETTGVCSYTCACGDSYTEEIPATGHLHTHVENVWDATCGTEGYTGDTFCDDCGMLISEGTVIPASGNHSYTAEMIAVPGCETTGLCRYTCVCGNSYTEAIPATGHLHTHVENVWDATCGTEGYTGDTFCDDCGMLISEGTVIPATDNHSYIAEMIAVPGCETTGLCRYTCVCGNSYTEAIPATGHLHTHVENVWDATCGTEGYTGDTFCDDCGMLISEGTVIPATGNHSYIAEMIAVPGCETTGLCCYTCVCGDSYTEEIPATGHLHTHVENVWDATCGTDGYTGDTFCDDCGMLISAGTVIPATGNHSYTAEIIAVPGCETTGLCCYTCVCGDSYTEETPATGHLHTRVENARDVTCGTDGYTGDTFCDDCGMLISAGTVIPATGNHSYTSEVTEPTCTEVGCITHTCTNCGDVYIEEIPATGHSFVDGECEHCGASEALLGDVNGDGRVNARDARLLLRYAAGLAGEDEIVLAAADYNGDGRVNARDARALLRYAAGLD